MTSQVLRHVAVIDIGKTNAKVAIIDLEGLAEIASRTHAEHGAERAALSALRH